MIKTIKFILAQLLKVAGLFFLLSLERVIGLPLIFSLLGLIWLDQVENKAYSRPLLILLFSFFIAIFYHTAWLATLIVWSLSTALVVYSGGIFQGKKRRFLITVLLQNLFWLWWLKIPANYILLAQLVVSYILFVVWLRIFKKDKMKNKD
jgi:hypothetical protein